MSIISGFKRLHKWLALLIGIQLILWIVSGIVFSFINHDNVNGGFIYKINQTNPIIQAEKFVELVKEHPGATEVTQFNLLDKSVFKLIVDDKILLIDAKTKKSIRVTENLVKQIAEKNYHGHGELIQVNLINELSDENRAFTLPSWQLVYADEFDSHLYFSTNTGEYQGIRTNSWRTFDFFMMLHFMDYGKRGDFNNALIIVAALILLFFSISGVLLVYSSFSVKDFIHIFNRIFQNNKFSVSLIDPTGNVRKIKIDKDERLIDALAENNIELESVCGGGGICGCCRVKLLNTDENVLQDHLTDHDTLDEEELKQGYRLACQLSVDANLKIELPEDLIG